MLRRRGAQRNSFARQKSTLNAGENASGASGVPTRATVGGNDLSRSRAKNG
jgi:hypothetical protein